MPRRAALIVLSAIVTMALSCGLGGAAVTAAPTARTSSAPVATCTRADALRIIRHTLTADLRSPELVATWTIGTTPPDAWAITIGTGEHTSRVVVSPKAPCRVLVSLTHHEWMHQMQVRYLGGTAMNGIDVEMSADCGSWILGSAYTPYIDRARKDGAVGCTPEDIALARSLIGAAGLSYRLPTE